MIDISTQKKLQVYQHGDVGPYIIIPYAQLDPVLKLLDQHNFDYWLDEQIITVDDRPPFTVINFGRKVDRDRVQHVLDQA